MDTNRVVAAIGLFAFLALPACQKPSAPSSSSQPSSSVGAPASSASSSQATLQDSAAGSTASVPDKPPSNPILGIWVGHKSGSKFGWEFASDWFADCCVGGEDTWQATYHIDGNRVEARPTKQANLYIFELQSDGTLKIVLPEEEGDVIYHRCSGNSMKECVAAEPTD